MQSPVAEERAAIVERLFPAGIPQLWCPLLTHYRERRGSVVVDYERIRAHLNHLAPFVKTFLVPGSTGDGWEMSAGQQHELITRLRELAAAYGVWVMVGVLRTGRGEARATIDETANTLVGGPLPAGYEERAALLAQHRVCGFTVTPPRGADLTQEEIRSELAEVAELGFPVAFYQLPQVTENEITPDTVADLVDSYPNFYLFKDTSGNDRVAKAALDYQNLFLVRGAEEDSSAWHRSSGGPYDGFLLSTVNCFARPYSQMLVALKAGDQDNAEDISNRVSTVARELFVAAGELPYGNPFSNANRAIDHVFAHGADVADRDPPLTCSGNRLPRQLIELAQQSLAQSEFPVGHGYL